MRSLHIVTDNILSITLLLNTHFVCVCHIIHISQDILLPIYMYLLYTLDGTATAWMKSSVFIKGEHESWSPTSTCGFICGKPKDLSF